MKAMSAVCSLAVGVGLGLSAISTHAEHLFFTVDGGLNLVDDFDIGGGAHMELDPGLRFDAGVGYNFIENENVAVAAGAEVGFLYNSLDKGVSPFGSVGVEGDLWQVPILGKIGVKFMPESAWNPYVSVGGGLVYSSLEVDSIGGTPTSLSGDEWDPAFQASIGVKYKLNDTSAVGLGYKFLVTFPDDDFEEVVNHGIVAAFSMSF